MAHKTYATDPRGSVPEQVEEEDWLIDWVKGVRSTRHKIGNFGDVLSSLSLGLVVESNTTKANMHP